MNHSITLLQTTIGPYQQTAGEENAIQWENSKRTQGNKTDYIQHRLQMGKLTETHYCVA